MALIKFTIDSEPRISSLYDQDKTIVLPSEWTPHRREAIHEPHYALRRHETLLFSQKMYICIIVIISM